MSSEELTEAETTSGESEDYDSPSFYGNMKTSLCWDASRKHLSVAVRQYVESARKMELKYKVCMGTHGQTACLGTLMMAISAQCT